MIQFPVLLFKVYYHLEGVSCISQDAHFILYISKTISKAYLVDTGVVNRFSVNDSQIWSLFIYLFILVTYPVWVRSNQDKNLGFLILRAILLPAIWSWLLTQENDAQLKIIVLCVMQWQSYNIPFVRRVILKSQKWVKLWRLSK